jgi:lipoprotein-releasing system permease protein
MRSEDIVHNPTLEGKVGSGSLEALKPGSGNIAIGARLAEQLGVRVGDEISLITPDGNSTPFGTVPRIVSYRIAATFEIGVYDYDKAYIFMPIEDAQTFLMMGDTVGMIQVQTVAPDQVQAVLAPIAQKYAGRAVVVDWRSLNASLFEALQVERVVMFWILSLIILVAAFNILSSLIMLVRAKTRDIAILRTMGASRSAMLRIFITVGVSIGSLGTLAGVILGLVILHFRQNIVNSIQYLTGQNLWDPSIRFITELPSKTSPFEVFAIVALALGSSFLFTLYPAWKAASTDPVQVLRYE